MASLDFKYSKTIKGKKFNYLQLQLLYKKRKCILSLIYGNLLLK